MPIMTNAAELQEEAQEEIFALFDFGEIEQLLKEVFPREKIDLKNTILGLISGEIELSLSLLKGMMLDQLAYEVSMSKSSMIHILLLSMIAAIFHNFSGIFHNSHVSEMSFYVLYMFLITICLESFRMLVTSATTGIGNLTEFLKLLGPIYFIAVAVAKGSVSSVAFYHLILILIYITEILIKSFLLPLVQVYMVIQILNHLSSEELLSKFGEFIHTIIVWVLRGFMAGVIGINVIQGMLNPAIDSVKRSVLTRGGEAIPIVGNLVGGAAEVILGTAVLIKNGIGVAGAIICVAICIKPVVQMMIITLLYKVTSALLQPISDKRVIGCISVMADGTTLLLRILLTSCALFLISIAIIAVTTS